MARSSRVLRGDGDATIYGQVGEETFDIGGADCGRAAFAVEEDAAANPANTP